MAEYPTILMQQKLIPVKACRIFKIVPMLDPDRRGELPQIEDLTRILRTL